MFGRRRVFSVLVMAALGTAALFSSSEICAQPRGNSAANRMHAGHGWANRNTWWHRQADRRMGHAIEYSRDLRDYSAYPQANPPQGEPAPLPVTRYPVIVIEEIGDNIAGARSDFARVRKSPAGATDADAQRSIQAIEQDLAAAAEQHARMEECCANGEVDTEMLMQCCDDAIQHLEAAKAKNAHLLNRFAPRTHEGATTPAVRD